MKKHKYRYSRLLAFVFALLFVTASVNAQTCLSTNAEASVNPPAGWVVNGLKPSAATPLAGDSSYVSEGFYTSTTTPKSYTFASPVITGDIAFTDQFTVDFKWRAYQPYWATSYSFTINVYVKNMATGTSYLIKSENKTSQHYSSTQTFTLNGLPRTATGFAQGFVAHQFIIEFKPRNTVSRAENWIKVDDIVICNSFTQPPLAGGGSTPPDIYLSLVSTSQDDAAQTVYGNININKGPASPCSDPSSPNCFTQHDVKVFRHKFQLADDEFVETQMVGTWTIPASTSSSVTTIYNQLLNDGTYYYKYFVSDEPSYNAANQPFPKVEYVAPEPDPDPVIPTVFFQNTTGEDITIEETSGNYESHLVPMYSDIHLELVPGRTYKFWFGNADIGVQFMDENGSIIGSFTGTLSPVTYTIPEGAVAALIEYL